MKSTHENQFTNWTRYSKSYFIIQLQTYDPKFINKTHIHPFIYFSLSVKFHAMWENNLFREHRNNIKLLTLIEPKSNFDSFVILNSLKSTRMRL